MPLTRLLDFVRGPRVSAVLAAVSGLTALGACIFAPAQPAAAATFVPISGAGSTWSYNAINAWATNVAGLGMRISYAAVGSTSGRQDFAQGTVDWAASEIPYGQDGSTSIPPPQRGFTYMPDTAGGVALMYNLHVGGSQVTNLRLSGAVIAGIFTNQITMWNDPKIAADNPGLSLLAEKIVPVVRTDSGGGANWTFTQWMSATQGASWTAYCAVVGLSPCAQVSAYPVQPGTNMIGNSGDFGVSGYVAQPTAEGAIGVTEHQFALETGFPVAKILNAAGYYTAPTPDNVGVSLLQAQVNANMTENLSQVYANTDPRTYELSYYSYMILPTALSSGMTSDKGYTLGAFGSYLLCQGQQQVDTLGYAALPINLVEAGFAQLQNVPGNQVPTTVTAQLQGCGNPTVAADGTDLLASTARMPAACDQLGPLQCAGPPPPPPSPQLAGTVPITMDVPPTGALTVTVAPGAVILIEQGTTAPLTATGTMNDVTVTDTRNTYPGWVVYGVVSDFAGGGSAAGSTIPGDQLGWRPMAVSPLVGGAALGTPVAPATSFPNGLGDTAQVLAAAPAGQGLGTNTLSASLTLDIPLVAAGPYSGNLTITYLSVGTA